MSILIFALNTIVKIGVKTWGEVASQKLLASEASRTRDYGARDYRVRDCGAKDIGHETLGHICGRTF